MRGRGHVNMDVDSLRRALEGESVWIAYPDERARRRGFERMQRLVESIPELLPLVHLVGYQRIVFAGLGRIIFINAQEAALAETRDPLIQEYTCVGGEVDWEGTKGDAERRRERRFDQLRQEKKTLGEINTILEAEGFSEVMGGPGLLPCPTPNHVLVRQAKTARADITRLKPWYHDDQTDPTRP